MRELSSWEMLCWTLLLLRSFTQIRLKGVQTGTKSTSKVQNFMTWRPIFQIILGFAFYYLSIMTGSLILNSRKLKKRNIMDLLSHKLNLKKQSSLCFTKNQIKAQRNLFKITTKFFTILKIFKTRKIKDQPKNNKRRSKW